MDTIPQIIYNVKQDWDMPDSIINSGYCEDFAVDVSKTIKDQTDSKVSIFQTGDVWSSNDFNIEMPVHYWIVCDGIHYDAETPEGVKEPENLPFFSRLKGTQMS